MARPQPTPVTTTVPPEEVVTPLQKLLTGTFLISLVVAPLAAFGIYFSPIHKGFPGLYSGDFWLIGAAAGVGVSFVLAFLWMTYVPKLLVRRSEKKKLAEEQAREQRRQASKRASGRKAEEE